MYPICGYVVFSFLPFLSLGFIASSTRRICDVYFLFVSIVPPRSPTIAYRYVAPSGLCVYGSRPALEVQTLYGHCHLPPILHIFLADISLPIPMPKYFNVVHSLCLYVYISERIEFRPFQTAFAYIFLLSGFLSWPNNIVITRQLENIKSSNAAGPFQFYLG